MGTVENPDMSKKIFTLKESLELLPRVQELTNTAAEQAEVLVRQLEALPAGEARREFEERYDHLLRSWAAHVMELGVEVKGMWLVDFDSGDGIYYCWHHPERTIEYFHDYGTGYSGRRPLGKLGTS